MHNLSAWPLRNGHPQAICADRALIAPTPRAFRKVTPLRDLCFSSIQDEAYKMRLACMPQPWPLRRVPSIHNIVFSIHHIQYGRLRLLR
jgi:hypothetical protein